MVIVFLVEREIIIVYFIKLDPEFANSLFKYDKKIEIYNSIRTKTEPIHINDIIKFTNPKETENTFIN